MVKRGLMLLVLLCVALPAYAWQLQTRVATVGGNMTGNGVTQTSANGTVYKSYTNDAQPVVVITADTGYKISSVSVNGAAQSPVPVSPASYTMGMVVYPTKTTQSVVAYFTKETYTLTTSAGTGGSVSPGGTSQVQFGTAKTVVFSPLAGKNVVDISGQPAGTVLKNYATGAAVTLPAPVDVKVSATFTMPAAPVTLTGVFVYITASTDGPKTVLFPGNAVTLTATCSDPTATFTWQQIGGPGWAPNAVPPQLGISGTGPTLTFTPAAMGTYQFNVYATASGATATAYAYVFSTDDAVAVAEAQCNICHRPRFMYQDEFNGWAASVHADASPPTMCYSCHVGARHSGEFYCAGCHVMQHTADYTDCNRCHNPHTLTVSVAADSCAQCHPGQDAAWSPSPHATNETQIVGCIACHTSTVAGTHPSQMPTSAICQSCHGLKHGANFPDCAGCHNVHSTEAAGGGGCSMCHDFPPTSGAHAAHYALEGTEGSYTDLKTLEERDPAATMETAPKVYAFGCAVCHSVDEANHMNGQVDVILYEAAADPASIKARNAVSAAYNADGTCSGVYCHSSGQETPTYQTTLAWLPEWRLSTDPLACDACHGNPPRYPSGGLGAATANSHIALRSDGYTGGHFSGIRGPGHTPQHGNPFGRTEESSPMTCQTCHYETTDPASAGPDGFYWLNTSGNYQMPGMVDPTIEAGFVCGTCHNPNDPDGRPAVGVGELLPLRHVNGKRDVKFDPRETIPSGVAGLPAAPNTPERPIWFTKASKTQPWPTTGAPITWTGTSSNWTRSWSLSNATYDPATKTCTNTSCHVYFENYNKTGWPTNPVWGMPFGKDPYGCRPCHNYY